MYNYLRLWAGQYLGFFFTKPYSPYNRFPFLFYAYAQFSCLLAHPLSSFPWQDNIHGSDHGVRTKEGATS